MFEIPYHSYGIGKNDTNNANPHKIIRYKFRAKHRTYLVTFELYSFGLVAVKYCDVKDKDSKKAYHKIFNDGDAIRVIGTCFHIMRKYFLKNKDVNFVFHASLREITQEIIDGKTIPVDKLPEFIERYKRVRYSIYRYGMLNLFPYEQFTPIEDKENCIYVLINKKSDSTTILTQLTAFLLKHHDTLFDPD